MTWWAGSPRGWATRAPRADRPRFEVGRRLRACVAGDTLDARMRIPIRPAVAALAVALASPAAAAEPAPVGPPIGSYVFWGVVGGIGGGLIGIFGGQRVLEAQV